MLLLLSLTVFILNFLKRGYAKYIATELNIEDQSERIYKNKAYITMKDHKNNFPNKVTCRVKFNN